MTRRVGTINIALALNASGDNFGRSLPRKPAGRPKRVPIARNPNGVNTGGNCLGCSNQVPLWYHYQICDHCINPGAVERNPVPEGCSACDCGAFGEPPITALEAEPDR